MLAILEKTCYNWTEEGERMTNDFKKNMDTIRKQIDETTLPLKKMQEQLDEATRPIKQMQEQIKIAGEPLKKIQEAIPKPIFSKEQIEALNSISIVMKPYFNKMQDSLRKLGIKLSKVDFKSKLNGMEAEKLNEFYWVIPYDMTNEELNELVYMENIDEFNNFIINHFDKLKIEKLILEICNNFEKEDKKEIIRQIQVAMDNELYSMCITTLMTVLDGLTLELLNPISAYQHKSYKAIDAMLEYINEAPLNEFGYEVYLKVRILNNFYLRLYEDERRLKDNDKDSLSRHLNSHGVKYLNNILDSLRLLNAIYFCQEIIKETKMQDRFFMEKKRAKGKRKFKIMENKNDE